MSKCAEFKFDLICELSTLRHYLYLKASTCICIYIYIYIYTKILEVNLFAFAYRLFRRDFSPLDGTYCIYVYIYTHIHTYIYTHIHTYIHMLHFWCETFRGNPL